jgi:hypothetical protein
MADLCSNIIMVWIFGLDVITCRSDVMK